MKNIFACEHVTNSMAEPQDGRRHLARRAHRHHRDRRARRRHLRRHPGDQPDVDHDLQVAHRPQDPQPDHLRVPPERAGARRWPPPAWCATPPSPPAPPSTASSGSRTPSIAATNALMNHPGVALILATGGNAMVRAAYSCGKPALGVGAGNVPPTSRSPPSCKRAVNDIVLSKAFDNGMVCASEQAVILDDEIYDAAMAEFADPARLPRDARREGDARAVHLRRRGRRATNCGGAKLNAAVVGPVPAVDRGAGRLHGPRRHVDHPGRGLLGRPAGAADAREARAGPGGAARHHAPSTASRLAEQMVEFDGLGHSAAIHTRDDALDRASSAAGSRPSGSSSTRPRRSAASATSTTRSSRR